uniref:BTB_2 domain-containing protein n=1 Tax=Steinernema glaseri TaxID=37863 RepID=A0A1I8AG90_9BILA
MVSRALKTQNQKLPERHCTGQSRSQSKTHNLEGHVNEENDTNDLLLLTRMMTSDQNASITRIPGSLFNFFLSGPSLHYHSSVAINNSEEYPMFIRGTQSLRTPDFLHLLHSVCL